MSKKLSVMERIWFLIRYYNLIDIDKEARFCEWLHDWFYENENGLKTICSYSVLFIITVTIFFLIENLFYLLPFTWMLIKKRIYWLIAVMCLFIVAETILNLRNDVLSFPSKRKFYYDGEESLWYTRLKRRIHLTRLLVKKPFGYVWQNPLTYFLIIILAMLLFAALDVDFTRWYNG